MLIIVAVLVFYNEYNKTMNIAEIGLLIVALIAIVRASMNYINLDDTATWEGFSNGSSGAGSRKAGNKLKGKNKMEDVIVLESSRSKEYFDTDESKSKGDRTKDKSTPQTTKSMLNSLGANKIDSHAVSQINSLLGKSSGSSSSNSHSKFDDIPTTTQASATTIPTLSNSRMGGIESIFSPQIQIGKGALDALSGSSSGGSGSIDMQGMNMTSLGGLGVPDVASLASTASALGVGDNMTFSNTMKPTSNLWSSNLDYMDMTTNWSQSMTDYNKGKWNPNTYAKASDYIDYYNPSAYGMSTPTNTSTSNNNSKSGFDDVATTTAPMTMTPMTTMPSPTTLDSTGQSKKLCGAYDDLKLDQSGNLVVQNYTQAKKWMPGYTYVPPVYWDVPQKHVSICQGANPNAHKLTGLVDRGLPINALELNPDGSIASTEDTVSLTNVGSIMPKFNYQETPFSKPYI